MATAKTPAEKKPKAVKAVAPVKAEKKSVQESAMTMAVYTLDGKVEKQMDLPKEIVSAEGNPKLLAQYVRVYQTNQRQGNAATKTRSEVIGTTKKIYRQKGTGRARHGAKKAPIFVGGGVTFGPQPRDFDMKLNKKQKRKALFYSLSLKAKDQTLLGFSNSVEKEEPKTKKIANILKVMGAERKKVLVVVPAERTNLQLAARNLKNVEIATATNINPYMILNNRVVVFTENAMNAFVTHFANKNEN